MYQYIHVLDFPCVTHIALSYLPSVELIKVFTINVVNISLDLFYTHTTQRLGIMKQFIGSSFPNYYFLESLMNASPNTAQEPFMREADGALLGQIKSPI
jgi:hypothetical protein